MVSPLKYSIIYYCMLLSWYICMHMCSVYNVWTQNIHITCMIHVVYSCKYLKIRYRINFVRIYCGKKWSQRSYYGVAELLPCFLYLNFWYFAWGFFVYGYPLPKSHFNNDPKFWLVKKKNNNNKAKSWDVRRYRCLPDPEPLFQNS